MGAVMLVNGPLIGIIAVFVMPHEGLQLDRVSAGPDGGGGGEGVAQVLDLLPGRRFGARHEGEPGRGRHACLRVGPCHPCVAWDQSRRAGGPDFIAERPQTRCRGSCPREPQERPTPQPLADVLSDRRQTNRAVLLSGAFALHGF
jgi:hypothetical protein